MALHTPHSTQPSNSTGAPVTRTRYALASEVAWPSSWTCLCLGSKNNCGNWRWRMSWSVGCTSWGEVNWLIRDLKELRRENCVMSPRCIKTWLSNIQPSAIMASSARRQLWPPLHVGFSSARWLLSKPPELLEATKRHSIGHL
jgi:hypothetical protein